MRRNRRSRLLHKSAGFSLLETNIALMVASVVAGFALIGINGIVPGVRANAALNQTVAQFRSGREKAIAQRRNVELRFLGNNQIQLLRDDVPAGTTVLSTISLENGAQFQLFDGVPDTPDLFGNGTAVNITGAGPWMFLSDGTFVDSAGNPANGSVFLGLANHVETARAVTILGATGRIRGYRWTSTSWIK